MVCDTHRNDAVFVLRRCVFRSRGLLPRLRDLLPLAHSGIALRRACCGSPIRAKCLFTHCTWTLATIKTALIRIG